MRCGFEIYSHGGGTEHNYVAYLWFGFGAVDTKDKVTRVTIITTHIVDDMTQVLEN